MRKIVAVVAFFIAWCLVAHADTVVLSDGTSYTGRSLYSVVEFTDQQGIKYTFPRTDVQTLVFNASVDTVTLRNGKSYVGHFTGKTPIAFTGEEGVQYQFPIRDVESLIFNDAGQTAAAPKEAKVFPFGTNLVVRTDEPIDSANTQTGQLYRATLVEGVLDSEGAQAIPAGSPAQLLIRQINTGGTVSSPELVLDLYSVTVNGKQYRVVSSNIDESSRTGMGKNRRTAEFLGGGAAIGGLIGGIFGGGKGAGIGALSGVGGGALTQVFTRGKAVKVPPESVLHFRLERRLVLQPAP